MDTVLIIVHLMVVIAFKWANASILAPFQYLEIVGATVLGFYIFGDLPDGLTFVGIALIIGSGLYVFVREQQLGKRPAPVSKAKVRFK